MATVGTVTQTFDQYRNCIISITGITANGNTPSFRSQGFVIGSWQLIGTLSSATAKLQGSNDGGTTWADISTAVNALGLNPMFAQTAPNMVPLLYQFVIASGVSPSLSIQVALMSTFG